MKVWLYYILDVIKWIIFTIFFLFFALFATWIVRKFLGLMRFSSFTVLFAEYCLGLDPTPDMQYIIRGGIIGGTILLMLSQFLAVFFQKKMEQIFSS